jgi:hypothetical protein
MQRLIHRQLQKISLLSLLACFCQATCPCRRSQILQKNLPSAMDAARAFFWQAYGSRRATLFFAGFAERFFGLP